MTNPNDVAQIKHLDSLASHVNVLGSASSTVDGGLWYELSDGSPILKLYLDGSVYVVGAGSSSAEQESSIPSNITNLVAYLPFTSTLDDLCGNEWTATGSPTIVDGALYLNGSNYLKNSTISNSIGNTTWTIDFWATETGAIYYGAFFGTYNQNYSYGRNQWVGVAWHDGLPGLNLYDNDKDGSISVTCNTRHHYALTYDGGTLRLFVDGTLSVGYNHDVVLGGNFVIGSAVNENERVTGTIEHFRIYKDIALWTENFTPPTAADYAALATYFHS